MSIFREHKTSADRSASDRSRHKKKIEKAIKEGITDIIAEESIIGQDGKKTIKIPVRGIKEWQFVYGDNEGHKKAGSAPGNNISQGQIVKKGKKDQANGGGSKPGNDIGEEIYEVEITLEELAEYLFESLLLPDLEKKKLKTILSDRIKKHGITTQGIRPRLDKKKSAIERIKRKIATIKSDEDNEKSKVEEDEHFPFHTNDLRYSNIKAKPKEATNAVIFFMMDVSGSMSKDIKFIARSFFFLLYQFIRYKYEKTEIVFIAHTTEANEVNESQFFSRIESGGTHISSASKLAIKIIEERYHQSAWNIYAFHCTDGDNFPEDDNDAIEELYKLSDLSQMTAYTEIIMSGTTPNWQSDDERSTLTKRLMSIDNKHLKLNRITSTADIWPVFNNLFGGINV